MKRARSRRKAFTIVELLVVILIISMLAAFVAPRMFKELGRARKDIARAKMATIENAIGRFYIDCGRYPDESEGLEVLAISIDKERSAWLNAISKGQYRWINYSALNGWDGI